MFDSHFIATNKRSPFVASHRSLNDRALMAPLHLAHVLKCLRTCNSRTASRFPRFTFGAMADDTSKAACGQRPFPDIRTMAGLTDRTRRFGVSVGRQPVDKVHAALILAVTALELAADWPCPEA